jgi:YD repeat-containing protein
VALYDLLGRIRTKQYPNQSQIEWTYDDPAVGYSKGRLTRVVDAATSTTFAYDAVGRVTGTSRVLDGTTYTMMQSYDALGRPATQTFPDQESITFSYNEAGWLRAIPGYVSAISYNARGQRTQVQYANGVTTTSGYYDQPGSPPASGSRAR